ncbi:MAG: NAD-dependent epimerase/dehydratase family protein [Gemmatimonadales bacterium]
MKVLVTGSSGHIGSAVAARLGQEARVIGLDLRPGPETTRIGDVADAALVSSLVPRVDAIVHTAALHVPHLSSASAARFRRVNVDATRILLDAAIAAGVTRFVLLSTTSVYGCGSRGGPPATWVDESLAPNPEDIYDQTKLAAESLCREAAGPAMSTVILRLARCFPEPDHLVAFYRLYRGVDRRDVADAHLQAVTAPVDGTTTVNISGASPFRREDLPTLWDDPWTVIERRAPGIQSAFERRAWPLPQRVDRVYAIDQARQVLKYRPRFGVSALLA